jgi:hypothetical protein
VSEDYPDSDILAAWPNCSVSDCEYKANIPGGAVPSDGSGRCVPHQQGRIPMPFGEYQGALESLDLEKEGPTTT